MHITFKKTKIIPARTVVKTKVEQVPNWLADAVQEFVDLDRRIVAIKLVRSYYNRNDPPYQYDKPSQTTLGLKEAKDFVEQNFTRRTNERW